MKDILVISSGSVALDSKEISPPGSYSSQPPREMHAYDCPFDRILNDLYRRGLVNENGVWVGNAEFPQELRLSSQSEKRLYEELLEGSVRFQLAGGGQIEVEKESLLRAALEGRASLQGSRVRQAMREGRRSLIQEIFMRFHFPILSKPREEVCDLDLSCEVAALSPKDLQGRLDETLAVFGDSQIQLTARKVVWSSDDRFALLGLKNNEGRPWEIKFFSSLHRSYCFLMDAWEISLHDLGRVTCLSEETPWQAAVDLAAQLIRRDGRMNLAVWERMMVKITKGARCNSQDLINRLTAIRKNTALSPAELARMFERRSFASFIDDPKAPAILLLNELVHCPVEMRGPLWQELQEVAKLPGIEPLLQKVGWEKLLAGISVIASVEYERGNPDVTLTRHCCAPHWQIRTGSKEKPLYALIPAGLACELSTEAAELWESLFSAERKPALVSERIDRMHFHGISRALSWDLTEDIRIFRRLAPSLFASHGLPENLIERLAEAKLVELPGVEWNRARGDSGEEPNRLAYLIALDLFAAGGRFYPALAEWWRRRERGKGEGKFLQIAMQMAPIDAWSLFRQKLRQEEAAEMLCLLSEITDRGWWLSEVECFLKSLIQRGGAKVCNAALIAVQDESCPLSLVRLVAEHRWLDLSEECVEIANLLLIREDPASRKGSISRVPPSALIEAMRQWPAPLAKEVAQELSSSPLKDEEAAALLLYLSGKRAAKIAVRNSRPGEFEIWLKEWAIESPEDPELELLVQRLLKQKEVPRQWESFVLEWLQKKTSLPEGIIEELQSQRFSLKALQANRSYQVLELKRAAHEPKNLCKRLDAIPDFPAEEEESLFEQCLLTLIEDGQYAEVAKRIHLLPKPQAVRSAAVSRWLADNLPLDNHILYRISPSFPEEDADAVLRCFREQRQTLRNKTPEQCVPFFSALAHEKLSSRIRQELIREGEVELWTCLQKVKQIPYRDWLAMFASLRQKERSEEAFPLLFEVPLSQKPLERTVWEPILLRAVRRDGQTCRKFGESQSAMHYLYQLIGEEEWLSAYSTLACSGGGWNLEGIPSELWLIEQSLSWSLLAKDALAEKKPIEALRILQLNLPIPLAIQRSLECRKRYLGAYHGTIDQLSTDSSADSEILYAALCLARVLRMDLDFEDNRTEGRQLLKIMGRLLEHRKTNTFIATLWFVLKQEPRVKDPKWFAEVRENFKAFENSSDALLRAFGAEAPLVLTGIQPASIRFVGMVTMDINQMKIRVLSLAVFATIAKLAWYFYTNYFKEDS